MYKGSRKKLMALRTTLETARMRVPCRSAFKADFPVSAGRFGSSGRHDRFAFLLFRLCGHGFAPYGSLAVLAAVVS